MELLDSLLLFIYLRKNLVQRLNKIWEKSLSHYFQLVKIIEDFKVIFWNRGMILKIENLQKSLILVIIKFMMTYHYQFVQQKLTQKIILSIKICLTINIWVFLKEVKTLSSRWEMSMKIWFSKTKMIRIN